MLLTSTYAKGIGADMPASFRAIIALWPSRAAFARDVGIIYNTAAAWYGRDTIPAENWVAVIEAAARRGLDGVNAEKLAALAAANKPTNDKAA